MARPRMVRADTLDLQDHYAPSAKDHTHAVHTNDGTGLAPHQEKELRHADHDSRAEILHGPTEHDGTDIYDGTEDIHIGLGVHRDETDFAEADDGDHSEGEDDDLLDDDLMDKISSSPSIDDDDINFEFVYALHNFVATVDGQANASKGDNMVLLDDSNSYWWLVRIVKDGSIGYLPAEHIETPTERLARLNKHRNVDLSATMLGDNLEKSKNPLKKAMRRRNAKTVTFTSPTYIEASDNDYSTEEEDDDDDVSFTDEYAREEYEQQEEHNEAIVVEPLRPKTKAVEEPQITEQEPTSPSPEKPRSSQEIFEQEDSITPTSEPNVSRSRNGTLRNTDSFFKDDTAETKKISLTPNLLRDETAPGESREPRISLEALDKLNPDEKKDDKKKKDKKSGMLSGLFKRKDKKSKSGDDEENIEKHSGELSRSSPTPKTSMESVSSPEARPTKQAGPSRQTSKLQKQQQEVAQPKESLEQKETALREHQRDQTIRQVVLDEVEEISGSGSSRSRPYEVEQSQSNTVRVPSPSRKPTSPTSPSSPTSPVSPIGIANRQPPQSQGPYTHSVTSPPQKFPPKQTTEQTRFAESPVNIPSPLDRQRSPSVPGLTTDLPAADDDQYSPDSPPLSPADTTDSRRPDAPATPFEAPTPTWSDASLRSYLEDENELRDLYVIVYDNTNIPPAGPEHPITGNLFKDESKRLREMNSQLDSLLSEWVTRRLRRSTSQ
ncbi:hypothetical protein AN1099.2 [Aspergillus nidulans FGSC A4]|uniref:SH3 domain-containing protein n=1 Tax=Emericella nidulans (strain FGSC A4 / ATCC 38163 / CBS 112.46 / NRRL 194 / M139) TaxID=227321 RepID=Q5BED1_EMENI|nr:protein phosphatase regulator BUD14 [Aspergillus nidulans FGSC A4]EAA66217.1 hypothetical protein AN1099.2 [Aspergillus nidulans FGSC A4]CBF88145.1 TPA: conserved hypothetical protein, tea4 homologue TeaC (Eurofung) [Aspergillus nidulans FGSC A4]|eukprot:XP_658703.1 hypothetical protein AN1099.2 [Aspergillus nidulans FGSC A4]